MQVKSRQMALAGMMTAIGAAALLLGGVIPLATFVCPAIAGLALVPVREECGRRMGAAAWIAISLLGVLFGPDKEASLLFAFLGWYPVFKDAFLRIRRPWPRWLAELAALDVSAGAMLLTAVYLFGLSAILAEYGEMSGPLLAAFVVMANVTLWLYGRVLERSARIYHARLRRIWMRGA